MTGQVRQPQVEDHDVGLLLSRETDRLRPVAGFADDLEAATKTQRGADQAPHLRNVVHEYDAYRHDERLGSPAGDNQK